MSGANHPTPETVSPRQLSKRLRELARMFAAETRDLLEAAAVAIEAKAMAPAPAPASKRPQNGLPDGDEIVWPNGVEKRYGISPPTRWRWERSGRLPPRDVHLGSDKSGWRKSTLDNWERQRR